MRTFLITSSFLLITLSKAQSQECWDCLIAARNEDKMALEFCTKVDKKLKPGTNEKTVVSFVIGRLLLAEGKPDAALRYLDVSAKSSDSLFRSISLGLIGDCYLDKNNPDLALEQYVKASGYANSTFFTPYFLNKQGIVFQVQKQEEDFERIGSRLRVNHINFFNSFNLSERYPKGPSKYDASNRELLDDRIPAGPYGIGVVNGTPAGMDLFYTKLKQFELSYENYPDFGMKVPPHYQTAELAWGATADELQIRTHEIAFALNVTEREFHAFLYGENGYKLLPEIEQAFSSNGVFSKVELERYIADQENAADPEQRKMWNTTKKAIEDQAAQEKYYWLLGLGLYVTTKEAMLADELAKKTVQIKVVHFPRNNFPGTSFSADEKDLRNYFEQHKADPYYNYSPERRMTYFKFPVAVSSADTLKFLEELKQLKSEFEKTDSDSLFVLKHSDFPKSYLSWNEHAMTSFPVSSERARDFFNYPDELESEINNAQVGEVVGPYIDKKAFRLAKVIGYNEQLLTVRHILIGCQREVNSEVRERKRKLAEDLAKEINEDNFGEYVKRYSEDPGSREKGGIYADFLDYEMVTPFSDYAVHASIGKIGIVETDFGFHIMEVLDRKPARFPVLAFVEKKLVPNEQIKSAIKTEVSRLQASMNRKMQLLDSDDKKAYFDSIAANYGGSQLIVINECNPSMTYFNLQGTNDRMLEYGYGNNSKPSQFMAPIEDSTHWIFPFFVTAYSGSDYNLEQVREFLKLNYWSQQLKDSLELKFGKLNSIEELAKQVNLKVFVEEVSIGSQTTNEQMPAGFVEYLLSERKPKTGINWFKGFGPCVAYEIVSVKNGIPSIDYSTLKTSLQAEMTDNLIGLLKENSSLTLKTIYNYPLYRLNLRP